MPDPAGFYDEGSFAGMMMKFTGFGRIRMIVLAGILIATIAPVAAAGHMPVLSPARPVSQSDRQAISFDEAIRRVQAISGGRILSAEIKNRDGRVFYRIKVLTPSGHVKVYWVDAETGAVI